VIRTRSTTSRRVYGVERRDSCGFVGGLTLKIDY
jgi:hypothetical protein